MINNDSKFCIIYNNLIPEYAKTLESLEQALNCRGLSYTKHDINNANKIDICDFVFVIGGDGTILRTSKLFAPLKTPVFGINIGRLGFLSQVKQSEIDEAINRILANNFRIEDRLMLKSGLNLALNDFVVRGITNSRTGKFSLKINDKCVCEYIADGIIISTPTGSTAYGLSAGGPVIEPSLDAIVIVPICPHTLTARPLVIPANEKVSISSSEGLTLRLTSDGDDTGINFEEEIPIEKADIKARLVMLDNDFYNVIREKFHWGVAPEK